MGDLREKIWCFYKNNGIGVVGGGVCVDSRGVVITSVHLFGEHGRDVVSARTFNNPHLFRNLVIEHRNEYYGLCLVALPETHGPYPFIDLTTNRFPPNLPDKVETFSYIHRNSLSFSYVEARMCYKYCNVDFNNLELKDSISSTTEHDYDAIYANEIDNCNNYRTMPCALDKDYMHLYKYASNLPIILLSGSNPLVDGLSSPSSGSPVFRKGRGSIMLGIIAFIRNGYHIVIPTDVINKFLTERH